MKKAKKRTNNRKGVKKNVKNRDSKGRKNSTTGNGNLSVKNKLFVEEYLKDFNATRAWKIVHGNGMKTESACTQGYETLRKLEVMTEIDRRLTDLFEKLEVSNNMLLAAYVNEAFYDKRPFFDENDVFVGIGSLNIAQQAVIESVEIEDLFEGRGDERERVGQVTKIKFCNRKAARDVLMKYRGLIKDTINNNTIILGSNKTEVIITAAKELKEALGDSKLTELNKVLTN